MANQGAMFRVLWRIRDIKPEDMGLNPKDDAKVGKFAALEAE